MLKTTEMQEIILAPGRTGRNYWTDLWRFRELFYFLAWRDILIRYKQTILGVAWAVMRPLLTMIIFTVIFNRIAKLHSDGSIPYALLVMGGMVPWQFVSTSASEASTSLIMNSNLISKIYFPRLIVPASAVITSFVDFVITLGLMGIMMAYYRFVPDWHVVLLAPFIVLAFMASFGVGLWLAALNVEYRDFRFIVPFIVQFGLYVSPVGFSSSIVPAQWKILFSVNPVVGVIDGFRWALLRGQSAIWWPSVLMSMLVSTLLCSSGIWYFRRTEKTFADII